MFDDSAPLVSVIIPTYGRAQLLSRAIDSVLKQTYQNLEIIVINDNDLNSEHYQPTIMIMKRYENNPKVKFVSDGRNVGGSLARNKGIDASLGEYITFLDDDDYYYAEKINTQLRELIENKANGCVCNMDILKNGNIINDSRSYARVKSLENFLVYGNCFTPMLLVEKNVLKAVNSFTKAPRFQDHILLIKILNKKFKIHHVNESLFVHNDHEDFRITKNNLDSYFVRWSIEDEIIKNKDNEFLKNYWFKRHLDNVRVLRDSKKKIKSMELCFKILIKCPSFFMFKAWLKTFSSILIK